MSLCESNLQNMNLSFSGCGFLCIYHTGVAAAIKEYAPELTRNKISGASAGAIVAAGLISGVCISKATSTVLNVVTQAHSHSLGPLNPKFNLLGVVREQIVQILPADAYKKCNERLQISLTRWTDMKNVMVNKYDSNEELIDAIICSCFIPGYCGFVAPRYRGVAYIDGGFTDNQPSYDNHTVTVSPFSGESDICPPDWDSASLFGICWSRTSIRCTNRNLFRLTAALLPPSADDCSKMCLQGFEDALRFLTKNAMAPCIRCLTIQTNVAAPAEPLQVAPNPHQQQRNVLDVPLTRLRKRSSSNLLTSTRKRVESECDTCGESDVHANSSHSVKQIFPGIMKKTLEDAIAAENSFFKYIMSFRLLRVASVAIGIGKLPIDMLVVVTRNIVSFASNSALPKWLVKRLEEVVDFLNDEFNKQKLRYNRFSCQLSWNEDNRRSPELEVAMSADAREEKRFLHERDRRKMRKDKPEREIVSEWSWLDSSDDPDSVQNAVAYSQNHDSFYAFWYLGENNKMRSYELFNMSEPGRRHPCHSAVQSSSSRPVSMVPEECEEEASTSCAHGDDVDSGLSGVEQNVSSSRRDACCSPVHEFRRVRSTRRGTASSLNKHRDAPSVLHVGSSESEDADGALFVPSARRHRTQSCEYDGEPEQSDNE